MCVDNLSKGLAYLIWPEWYIHSFVLHVRLTTLPPFIHITIITIITMYMLTGEMMPKQLWDTTMDPKTRTLKLVSVEDAAAADRMFSVLMGDNVQPRKEFITANAGRLSSSDLDF